MKFRIRELTPGYRLEVCVPTLKENVTLTDPGGANPRPFLIGLTWIPVGHPYGSIQSAKFVAEEFARGGQIVEEFDVEPTAARV
jgi:hypothetical protein